MILKKCLSLLLSLCMLYGALPVNAQMFNFSTQNWLQTPEQKQAAIAAKKKEIEQHNRELDNRAAFNMSARGLYSGLGYFGQSKKE